MHFRDAGHGRTLLLLHALPVDGRMWDDQRASLHGDFRVIVPDFPGFGLSAAPSGSPSLDDWAGQLIAVLRGAGVEEAVVAGGSMGGYVALAMLRAAPQFVGGLALVNSRAAADSDEQRAGRLAAIDRIKAEGYRFVIEGAPASALSKASLARRPAAVARVRAMAAAATPAGVIAAQRAIGARPDSRAMLGQAKIPIAIIHGEDDPVVPVAEARELAASMPDATFSPIPEAGHLPSVEQPEAVTAALRELLRRTG
jgi:pimeloyl-ACP methyl ester carboxylesterase